MSSNTSHGLVTKDPVCFVTMWLRVYSDPCRAYKNGNLVVKANLQNPNSEHRIVGMNIDHSSKVINGNFPRELPQRLGHHINETPESNSS